MDLLQLPFSCLVGTKHRRWWYWCNVRGWWNSTRGGGYRWGLSGFIPRTHRLFTLVRGFVSNLVGVYLVVILLHLSHSWWFSIVIWVIEHVVPRAAWGHGTFWSTVKRLVNRSIYWFKLRDFKVSHNVHGPGRRDAFCVLSRGPLWLDVAVVLGTWVVGLWVLFNHRFIYPRPVPIECTVCLFGANTLFVHPWWLFVTL